LPACWRLLHGITLRLSLSVEGVRNVLLAWVPLVLGAGVTQLSGLIDTLLGSFTGPGGVSALGYAQLIQVLPISLFGASVTAVALPELSRDARHPHAGEDRGVFARGLDGPRVAAHALAGHARHRARVVDRRVREHHAPLARPEPSHRQRAPGRGLAGVRDRAGRGVAGR